MAEQVARIKILAQIDGLEGFDKLKGAFKGLQQAIGPADTDLSKARKEIIEFGKAGAKTEQVIRGQIDALKALQGQASIGGAVYRQLGKDIKDLGSAYREAATGVKQFTDAQLKSQIVGSKPSTFDKQIAALRRGLQDLSVYGRQYTDALTEIQRRQIPFNAALGRQNVIAGFEAYQQGGKGGSALPALPDTTAGLNQRLSELNAEFANLSRGGDRWIQVSREIANVQRQLNQEFANPAVEAARRRLEASRNTSSGFLAFSQGLGDRLAVQKSIERNQRKQAAQQAAPLYSAPIGPAPPSDLFRSIAGISNAAATDRLQLMGRSFGEVADKIKETAAASNGSINSLQAQRAAWERLRSSLGNNKTALREVAKEIEMVDRQLEKRGVGGPGIGAKVQAFGAIASGAIFGGVEGAIGGLAGAAFGGVGGAFAGAAIGGTVSMIRQNVVAMGEFSAEIAKLEIALRGVAGSASEFAAAQQVIRLAQIELNVPVMEATQGFTQLTAAIKGAGGNVGDAEVVFRGVTEAIKATGGSAEDVQGALTAMAQIFSKGKVSAEELQGQLGERLPGAVTLFAKATGRTLPQLQKDLEQGVVGLNDVMKFAASLSERYSEQAIKMASSTEDSTARMKVALDDLRRAFGSIVQPITASVQSIIAKLAEMSVRALRAVGLVKESMAELGAAGRAKDLQVRGNDALEALGSGYQSYSEKKRAFQLVEDLANAATPQKSLAGVQQNIRALTQARQIIRQINAEGLDERQLSLLQNYGSKLDGRISKEQEILATLQKQRKVTEFQAVNQSGKGDNEAAKAADKARAEAERLAAEQQRLDEAVAKAELQLSQTVFNNQIELIKKRYDYEQERIQMQRDIWAGTFEGIRSESARAANDFVSRLEQIRQRTREATLGVVVAEQNAAFNARMEAVTGQGLSGGGVPVSSTGIVARTGNTGDSTGAHLDLRWGDGRPITKADADKYFLVNGRAPSSFGVTSSYGPRNLFGRSFHRGIDFGTPAGSALTLKGGATFARNLGNTGAGGYAIEVMTPEGTMRALHLMANSAVRSAPAGVAAQTRRNVVAGGRAAGASAEVQQANAMLGLEAAQSKFMLQSAGVQYVQQRTQSLRDEAKAMENSNALLLKRMELEQSGLRPELIDAQMKIAEIEQQRADKLAQINENIQQNQYDVEAVAGFRLEIEETNAAYDRQIAAINAIAQAQTAAGVALKNRIGQIRQELSQLSGIENLIVNMSQTIEGSISTAISGAVGSMVTGATSIKQVLADMFRSIGEAFIKMAADIIAKQLVMVALNQLLGLFGGGGFSFGGAGPVSGASVFGSGQAGFNPAAFGGGFQFASGGVMTNVGPLPLKRYAGGGVANSPQMAVYGERGPEAYVPLPDGRSIPVKMKQRSEALNRYRPIGPMGTATGDSEGGSSAPGATGAAGAIDVRYSVERINNVEYVTAEQFRSGMQQAAAQGAQRGEQRALRSLQQSTAVRNRVGIR